MICQWVRTSASLKKGIDAINLLDNAKLEQFIKRIVSKIKVPNEKIFTEDENLKLRKIFNIDQETLILVTKTIMYVFKRVLKFIFMPIDLKHDLEEMGFKEDKTELLVKLYSAETKMALSDLNFNTICKREATLNFSWKLNVELSSEYHKKCSMPKVYLALSEGKQNMDVELDHQQLYSMFLQFESIQNELDSLMQ